MKIQKFYFLFKTCVCWVAYVIVFILQWGWVEVSINVEAHEDNHANILYDVGLTFIDTPTQPHRSVNTMT
jgi:hypothetical protein